MPVISSDGNFVAFMSTSSNLVSGGADSNGIYDIYVWQRSTGAITLVSHVAANSTTAGNNASVSPVISNDGSFVSFYSAASNLAGATDTNFANDVFLWQRSTNALTLVSKSSSSATTTSNGNSSTPTLSGDGNLVTYASTGSNLVTGTDTNSASDVFVYNRTTGTTTLVSHLPGAATTAGNNISDSPQISSDGGYITFISTASNLITGSDANNTTDVFLYQVSSGTVTLVSHTSSLTTAGNDESSFPTISSDGAFIAFTSSATNLITGSDANTTSDVYLYTRSTGALTLVSRSTSAATTTSNSTSANPYISANGNLIAYSSASTDLVSASDANANYDVFVYNRTAGTTSLASHTASASTVSGNNLSSVPVLSGDGSTLAFITQATNLATGGDANNTSDVFLRNLGAGANVLVSTHPSGATSTTAAGASTTTSRPQNTISDDGRYTVYTSDAANLFAGQIDANSVADIFLYDRVTNTTTLVSRAAGLSTTAGNGASSSPSISADGNYVVFTSLASNLVAGTDNNFGLDVFLWNRATGAITLASRSTTGASTAANASSLSPSISNDGSIVAFVSQATDLFTGGTDSNNASDVFVFNRSTGTVSLVSHANGANTTPSNNSSDNPVVSGDGNFVVFTSLGSNLTTSDTNAVQDVFVFNRSSAAISLVSRSSASATTAANGDSSQPSLSNDGQYIAFTSNASNILASDTNGVSDVFVFNRTTSTTSLVSHTTGTATTPADNSSDTPVISRDGNYVAFQSNATDLVAGTDANGSLDVFLFDRVSTSIALVSHAAGSATTSSNSTSTDAVFSPDSAYLGFRSTASNLITGGTDTNSTSDVFRYERSSGTVSLLSHIPSSLTTAGNGASRDPSLSNGGTYIAFTSSASNLLPDDANSKQDVFLFVPASTPNITVNDVKKAEGNSGTTAFTFTINLSSPSSQSVTVQFTTTSNTAKSRSDYLGTVGTLTFAPGEQSKTISVQVRGDVFREVNETYSLVLSNAVNGNLTDAVGLGTVLNDDHALGTFSNGVFTYSSPDLTFGLGAVGDTPLVGDFNNDGLAEIGVWRAGTFFLDTNGDYAITGADTSRSFGLSTDKPIVGDWTGNGIAKMGVFRNGFFYLDLNNDGLFNNSDTVFQFGASIDTPLVGDWNGDGIDDVGVWRSTNATFYLDSNGSRSFNTGDVASSFGSTTDKPLVGDWNGDRFDEIAVWRNGTVFFDSNGNHVYNAGVDLIRTFGVAGDTPLVGDWNGDGTSELGLGNAGNFRLDMDRNYLIGTTTAVFGAATDTPLTGDFTGDGFDDAAIFRNGFFYLDSNGSRNYNSGSDAFFGYGAANDKPVIGDWNGDGIDDVGVFRNGLFYLDSNGNRAYDVSDLTFSFGSAGDLPIAGDWNGDGIDEVGIWRPSNASFYLDTNASRSFNTGDAQFSFGSSTDSPIVGDWNGDGRTDVGIWRAGQFYLDSNGNQAFNAGIDQILAFGTSANKPITGRW